MQLLVLILALLAFTPNTRGTRTNAAFKAQRSSDADAADNSDVQFLEPADAEPMPAQDGAGADSVADEFAVDLAAKEAKQRHDVMSQFMNNFARNMRKAVLQDSQGDMPEDERETMLAQMGSPVHDPGPQDDNPDATFMRKQRRIHHRHMLNGGRMVPSWPAEVDEEPKQPVNHAHHRHMMLNHMLNAAHHTHHASYENSEDLEEVPEEQPQPAEQQAEEVPVQKPSAPLRAPDGRLVVADALGRKMPMLFSRPGEEQPQPKHSATQGLAYSFSGLVGLLALQ